MCGHSQTWDMDYICPICGTRTLNPISIIDVPNLGDDDRSEYISVSQAYKYNKVKKDGERCEAGKAYEKSLEIIDSITYFRRTKGSKSKVDYGTCSLMSDNTLKFENEDDLLASYYYPNNLDDDPEPRYQDGPSLWYWYLCLGRLLNIQKYNKDFYDDIMTMCKRHKVDVWSHKNKRWKW